MMQRHTQRPPARATYTATSFDFDALEPRRMFANGTLPGVPSVVSQFADLETHAEGLSYTLNESAGAPDASISNHYQGVVRYPGTGTPVFYVTQKNADSGGYIHVVKMGSRGTDGERLRSNIQVVGSDTENTAPPSTDTWTRSFHLDGTLKIDGQRLSSYVHPGGMAIVDNILFVAMDTIRTTGTGGQGSIVLFDLGADGVNRLNPTPIQVLPVNHSIDNVAVVKDGGNYLIWANGDGGNQIHVYRTSGTDLRASNLSITQVQQWKPTLSYYSGPTWPTGAGAHQSSTFIRQSSSATPDNTAALYMIAARHDGPLSDPLQGDDLADLYTVTPSGTGLKLTYVRSYHPTLRYDQGGTLGNFAAASGAYVSPTGELILYTAPHNDEDGFSTDNVRIGELRHRNVTRAGSPLLTMQASSGGAYTVAEGGAVTLKATAKAAVGPWIELFDDDHFGDRSIMVDYADRAKFELNDFNKLDDFTDRTSSLRWRLPVGMSVELFENANFGGAKKTITGNGGIQEIADLGSWGGRISSMRFVGTNGWDTITYAWDLDNDGVFGETGTAAGRGNETGASPVFNAALIDGPATLPIKVRVADGTGVSRVLSTSISVLNIPPTVTVSGPTQGAPLKTLSFTLTAADPSLADRTAKVKYAVDFGDGQTATYTPPAKSPGLDSRVTITHAYARRGTFSLKVTAADKNGGVSAAVVKMIQIDTILAPEAIAKAVTAKAKFSSASIGLFDQADDDDLLAGLSSV